MALNLSVRSDCVGKRTNFPYGNGTPFALTCLRSCESLPDFLTSDTLADSRVQKPKNFLAFFPRLLPRHGYFPAGKFRDHASRRRTPPCESATRFLTPPPRSGKEMEMERKFLVLLRRSHKIIVLHTCIIT